MKIKNSTKKVQILGNEHISELSETDLQSLNAGFRYFPGMFIPGSGQIAMFYGIPQNSLNWGWRNYS